MKSWILTALVTGALGCGMADSPLWAQEDLPAANEEVARIMREFTGRGDLGDDSPPLSPEETLARLRVADDLKVELVAAEADLTQPIHLSFDAQGRLWVVQYRQYPFPAGLKVVRYDQHLRAVFDRVPAAPPHHVPGADVVTVFEDSDGDGTFDTHRDVISGLNIATSVAVGRRGIWVMNPPYLLCYPDADQDANPDGDPVVHLAGFGLEDTHSVANSITFGPDGWLYGVNGSTTTARVITSLRPTEPTSYQGQCVWRYHPENHLFEIYAEGGGNPFGLEIDAGGRLFSGTNNGETRGMYYPQGSYGIKGWGKHGPLTNPYAFGYFEHMRFSGDGRRFTEEFVIYQDDRLPPRYHGQMLAINPLQRIAFASHLLPDTSTYRTEDFENFIETDDRWFRPVDITAGPDGAIYVADWYDTRLTHVDPRDTWHKSSGRIYRISPKAESPPRPTRFDLTTESSSELLRMLGHPSRWFRFAAVQVLAERGDASATEPLWDIVQNPSEPRALEALWVIARTSGAQALCRDDATLTALLTHADPDVRRWTIRLLGDQRIADPRVIAPLCQVAGEETDPQVRSQLASSAARLPAELGIEVIAAMLRSDLPVDRQDRHIPLLVWWAVEAQYRRDAAGVGEIFAPADPIWSSQLARDTILARLAHRGIVAGDAEGFAICGGLLEAAPDAPSRAILMRGLEEGLAELSNPALPAELTSIIERYRREMPQSDLRLRLRQGDPKAIQEAIAAIASSEMLVGDRIELIEVLGQLHPAEAMAPLLARLGDSSIAVRRAALGAVAQYDDPSIGNRIAAAYQSHMDDRTELRPIAIRTLASRPAWARQLIAEIDALRIPAEMVPLDVVLHMQSHQDEELNQAIERLWGQIRTTPEAKQQQIERLRELTSDGAGNPRAGGALFAEHCGKCHKLFGEGGQVGPDLTGYERTNFDFLALAVADPSAAVREEFLTYQILKDDGQLLAGLMVEQSPQSVTLRTAEGQTIPIRRGEIESLQASPVSLMPDGLLEKLSDAQIQDLFRYVSLQGPPLP